MKSPLYKTSVILILSFLIGTPGLAALLPVADNSSLQEQISQINAKVNQKQQELNQLNLTIENYRNLIAQKIASSTSLTDEINLIDQRVKKDQLAIDLANDQLEQLGLEIKNLDQAIGGTEERISQDYELIAALARNLYELKFRKNTLEAIFAAKNFSEVFQKAAAIENLESELETKVVEIKEIRSNLKDRQELRAAKVGQIVKKKKSLQKDKADLATTIEFKKTILEQTKSSEQKYRSLLAELKSQQQSADNEITYLEKTLRDKQGIIVRLGNAETILSWPVTPTRGISTRFRDPEYPFRNLFEHPGIDIPQNQATLVRAAAAGVIGRAKNGGAKGYSYVMILHSNGVSTIYGHLSQILVSEDAYVARGQVIGLSGGRPGTVGAGPLTTGPHLHFEVRRDGVPVDPMLFLSDEL